MKIPKRLEDIFAHAVALEQSGRLRSTIYCLNERVYILNQDHTVMMCFPLRAEVDRIKFDVPVSFFANDYDSDTIEIHDGRISFIQSTKGFERVKSCRTPNMTPEEMDKRFRSYKVKPSNTVTIPSELLSLLDESLSHIEFSAVKGRLQIVQRNIYSGGILTITEKKTAGGLLKSKKALEDFEPMGLRTNDFLALFTFTDALDFHFLPDGFVAVTSTDKKRPMQVLISKCRYDEMGICHK